MTPAEPEVSRLCDEYAIHLWTRRQSGRWSDADESELQRWLLEATIHCDAYDRVATLWAMAGKLQGRYPRVTLPLRSYRSRRVWVACATVLVVAILVPLWHFASEWWNGVPVSLVAQRGEPRAIILADSTRIQLDANSELLVRLGARVRRALLLRGEAFFSVAYDAWKPFEVEIGQGRITALGTRFDVETLRDSTRIAVLEGRVGVRTSRGEVVLTAGHSGGYDRSGALLSVSDVDPPTLWASGLRHFEDEPLSAVVERLTRYHAVTFEFADQSLEELHLSGTFHITDLPLFLRTLSTALPIDAHWVSPQRVEFTARRDALPQHGS